MAAKRIYQIAKEFECDEKEIIAFLTGQGIKVGNRLSAVSDDAYNLVKAKFTAPPEPPPAPAPKPEPKPEPALVVNQPENVQPVPAPIDKPQFVPGKKNKKKGPKPPQPEGEVPQDEKPEKFVTDLKLEHMDERTRTVVFEATKAGNEFIKRYSSESKETQPGLFPGMDPWGIIWNLKILYPDSSPARYWQGINKLATKSFKLLNRYGLSHREELAEIREVTNPLGKEYSPREIFSDEENEEFARQQKLLFKLFGHGMGMVNDSLYDMKLKAFRMLAKYERMSFVDYLDNPDDELRSKNRPAFEEMIEAVTYSLRGVTRRVRFYERHKERIIRIRDCFFEWLDGYAKLKEQKADPAKLEKYLELEEKFFNLIEFISYDNLLDSKKNKPAPFDTVLTLINEYRDNMDDPDALRNFKYKVRGVTNVIYKPKEYNFLYRFAELEPHADYRPPEEIAAAEAAAKAAAEEAAKAAAEEAAETPVEEIPNS